MNNNENHEPDAERTDRVEETERLAYALWETRGCVGGSPEIDWFEAERQLNEHLESSE